MRVISSPARVSARDLRRGPSPSFLRARMLIFSRDSSVKERYRSNCVGRGVGARNASVKTLAPSPRRKQPIKSKATNQKDTDEYF